MTNSTDMKKWYLAEFIVSINVEHDPRNVVHINTVLVQAKSSESAYEAAMTLGEEENNTYTNSEGNQVTFKFRGLRDLWQMYDNLEHGAEISYEERIDVSEESATALVRKKENLALFSPPEKQDKPNYVAKDIFDSMIAAGFTKEELK